MPLWTCVLFKALFSRIPLIVTLQVYLKFLAQLRTIYAHQPILVFTPVRLSLS